MHVQLNPLNPNIPAGQAIPLSHHRPKVQQQIMVPSLQIYGADPRKRFEQLTELPERNAQHTTSAACNFLPMSPAPESGEIQMPNVFDPANSIPFPAGNQPQDFSGPMPAFASAGSVGRNEISIATLSPGYVATQGYTEERIRAALTKICQKMVKEYVGKIEKAVSAAGPELLERLNAVTIQNVADEMIRDQPYYLLDHLGD